MPELPEVEVLVRHLRPLLRHKTISAVEVRRQRAIRPTTLGEFQRALLGARIENLTRRGKYLLFEMWPPKTSKTRVLVGHLGMTGRMYLLAKDRPLPKHAAVVLGLGRERFVFEDTRYFGRMTLESAVIDALGPEPLGSDFTLEAFVADLKRSSRPIKVKLLDQSLVAGIGNIYASEALFRARLSPRIPARRLCRDPVRRLHKAIRETLTEAIEFGSTVPLDYGGEAERSGLFYYGAASEGLDLPEERLKVYDREHQPCPRCGTKIKRLVQAARSTFYCPSCQRRQTQPKSV